jgi:hypothetical protein
MQADPISKNKTTTKGSKLKFQLWESKFVMPR